MAAPIAGARQSAKKAAAEKSSAIDRYIKEAEQRGMAEHSAASAGGSIWSAGAPFVDLGRDPKASRVDDLVTIIVAERANAVASGTTKTSRKSSTQHSVNALYGKIPAASQLANLASTSGDTQLDGQGATTRQNELTTTLSARVTHVLPNGNMVIEGAKTIVVNSETQLVSVRGIIRPVDVSPANTVSSGQLSDLEVRINGKGVVNDAVRRPFFLYRLLLGLLPF